MDYHNKFRPKRKRNGAKIGFMVILLILCIGAFLWVFGAFSGNTAERSHVQDDGASAVFERFAENNSFPDSENTIIMIDAGHGYNDIGTSSKFLGNKTEKDITLEIAKKLQKMLLAAGFQVVMTRENDTPPDNSEYYLLRPSERAELCRRAGANIFVSIHCNSFPDDPNIKGSRIYFSTSNQLASKRLASSIAKNVGGMFNSRCDEYDMRPEDAFTVIDKCSCPGILLETGFVTNREDALNMLNPDWQSKMAQAIAYGVIEFLGGGINEV